MTAPTLSDYLNLSQSIYTSGGIPAPPSAGGKHPVRQPLFQRAKLQTECAAVAFTNGSVVVIAYEGMNWSALADDKYQMPDPIV